MELLSVGTVEVDDAGAASLASPALRFDLLEIRGGGFRTSPGDKSRLRLGLRCVTASSTSDSGSAGGGGRGY